MKSALTYLSRLCTLVQCGQRRRRELVVVTLADVPDALDTIVVVGLEGVLAVADPDGLKVEAVEEVDKPEAEEVTR